MLYLIRHTSVGIPKNICYGQTDVALSESFEEEAEIVHSKVDGITFDEHFSSPLSRCFKLAKQIIEKDEIQQDDRLKEMDFGDWELKTWDEINDSEEGKRWFADYTKARCPNGESFEDMTERTRHFYEEIKPMLIEGKNIAVFTHAGVLRSFMIILENISPEETFSRKVNYGEVLTYAL